MQLTVPLRLQLRYLFLGSSFFLSLFNNISQISENLGPFYRRKFTLPYHATGTWEANASGGVGNYAYQWQYYGYYGWTDYVGETGDEMTKTLYYDSDGHDLRCVVTSGSETASDEIHVFVTGEISFKSTPNPFNPTTKISFVLNKQQNVELIIYSIMGRKIKTVVNSNLDVGQHSYLWDGTDANGKPVSSGTYIYQLKVGNDVYNHKVVFTK
jgi:hypothetical protein